MLEANLELSNAVAEQFLRCADTTPAPLVTAMLVAFSKVQVAESFFERAAQKARSRDLQVYHLILSQVVPNLADFEPASFVRGHRRRVFGYRKTARGLLKILSASGGVDESLVQATLSA